MKTVPVRFKGKPSQRIKDEIRMAKSIRDRHPAAFLMGARRACEMICREVLEHTGVIEPGQACGDENGLDKLKNVMRQHKLLPSAILTEITVIQIWGNLAAHGNDPIQKRSIKAPLASLNNLRAWYISLYEAEDDGDTTAPKPKLMNFGAHNLRMRSAAIAGSTRILARKLTEKKKEAAQMLQELRTSQWPSGKVVSMLDGVKKKVIANRMLSRIRPTEATVFPETARAETSNGSLESSCEAKPKNAGASSGETISAA